MVIAISHLGYDKNSDIYYKDRGVAKGTRNIDMIIGGHSHTFINYPDYVTNLDGDKVPVVQTGSKGICLGYAKIKIESNGKPSFTYKLIPVKKHLDTKIDPVFAAKVDSYTTDVAKKMEEVIGYCPSALSKGNPESPLGNLTADGLIWAAKEFHGVDKAYAIQAGRELRVMVKPEEVNDEGMKVIARDMAAKIREEVKYPGQIKVNLIRESRAVDYAK